MALALLFTLRIGLSTLRRGSQAPDDSVPGLHPPPMDGPHHIRDDNYDDVVSNIPGLPILE
jgi:hypothetical protein